MIGSAPALLLFAAVLLAQPLGAQRVRVSGATSLRYIELRPLITDSLPQDVMPGETLLRQAADGRILRCIPGEPFCYDVRPGERAATVPVIHDVEVSSWGFARGASAFLQLRARNELGASGLWPRGGDALDVLAAYAELEREHTRVRIGRQWKISGLGFYNFDGVDVEARPLAALSIDIYGGRSLLRGLNESRTGDALESIEPLAPNAAGLLLGAHVRYQPNRAVALGSVYQVDFRNDGHGLYAELLAADAVVQLARLDVEAALELDLASGQVNEARLRVRPRPFGRIALHGEVRRYRPYFELWTIWGAFAPVGFDEAAVGLTWAGLAGRLFVQTDAAYRAYGDTGEDALVEFRNTGWGIGANVTWSVLPEWRLDAGYRVETGFGAARREARVGAARIFGDRASLAVQGLAFESLYEFRLDQGTVLGLAVEAAVQPSARTRVIAHATAYHHLNNGNATWGDWNQRRAGLRVQWTVGPEPGMPRGVSP